MSAINCFEDIIGFTRGECDCIADYEAEYSESLSGLFVDEMQGMSLRILDSLGGCEDLWAKMTRARENAINTFKIDLQQEIEKYKEKVRSYFSGDIGYKTFTTTVPKKTYHGLRLYSDVKGGKFVFRGITLILDTTEAVTLEIYDEYDLLYSYAVTSVAGRPTRTNVTPIELTLNRNYYFLVSTAGAAYNNKLTCGCGNYKWCFCTETPCYRYSRNRWTEWCMVAGVSGDVLADREDWSCQQNANGMIIHGSFDCSLLDSICTDESDFVNNGIDHSMAWAILYKTGEFLTNYILSSGEVSRYTLIGIENLNENRVYYNRRYAVMIDYIARSLEDERTDCYRCRPPLGMGKRTHLI